MRHDELCLNDFEIKLFCKKCAFEIIMIKFFGYYKTSDLEFDMKHNLE